MMNKKNLPHIITVVSFVVFIVLGVASASNSKAVKAAASIDEVTGLADKLAWLRNNAESGGNYILEVDTDERINAGLTKDGNLSFKDKSNITITLRGIGGNRTIISPDYPPKGELFSVGSGVTLILDENITLHGIRTELLRHAPNTASVVGVRSGGTLVMNDGSTITGGVNNAGDGGGVYVSGGGTFIMKGGTITGNICFPVADAAAVAATDGKYTNIGDPGTYKGAGVYVRGGTFTKTGGTIYGYTGDSKSNMVRDFMGANVSQNNGHAVYAHNPQGGIFVLANDPKLIIKRKETTAGPEVNLHYSNGEFSGSWDY